MDNILLISNCNFVGLGQSINLLRPDAAVHYYSIAGFVKNKEMLVEKFPTFTHAFLHPHVLPHIENDIHKLQNRLMLPGIRFAGYHPDICYLNSSAGPVHGPTGAYHSAICIEAYKRGMTVNDAVAAFNADTYEKCGYFNVWADERQALIDLFAVEGVHISKYIPEWTRHGPFMHTVNHPKIDVIFDVARAALIKQGLEPVHAPIKPSDNLLSAPVMPVYNEIAEKCGVEGSYQFKIDKYFKLIDLPSFVKQSFIAYDKTDVETLKVAHFPDSRLTLIEKAFAS